MITDIRVELMKEVQASTSFQVEELASIFTTQVKINIYEMIKIK